MAGYESKTSVIQVIRVVTGAKLYVMMASTCMLEGVRE
jgi:hypothetical protein